MTNALNLQEIDQEQFFNLSKFFIQSKNNLAIFGHRGLGKTFIAIQAAKECNLKINYVNLSVIERSDLAGYPDMNSIGDIITYKSPYFLPKLKDGEEPDSIILFDEVDKAPQEVTAPLLEILQFKKINGQRINVVSSILTGNLLNEGANSNHVSTALLDRCAKYILSFDFNNWLTWAKANNVHELILGFLKTNEEFACGKINDVNYASPSPRGWTLASEALIKAQELKINDIEVISQIISGFVGNEAGLRFKIWFEYYRKFEPFVKELVEDGKLNIVYKDLIPTEKLIFVITSCYLTKLKAFEKLQTKSAENHFS